MSVYKKLMAARLELQSSKLKKSGFNKFAGYSYFELGDFLPTIQEIFARHNLCGIISYGTDIARLTIIDMEGEGGSVEVTSPMSSAALKGCHEVQNLGAVQTYIRRYLWVTAMEIVEHDALDSSKPLDADKTSNIKAIKQGALDGIGDDLPEESKAALKELSYEVIELSNAGTPELALQTIRAFGPQGDEGIYLDRQLPSNVRSALRKAKQNQQQKAA